jgi:hypothetical protein
MVEAITTGRRLAATSASETWMKTLKACEGTAGVSTDKPNIKDEWSEENPKVTDRMHLIGNQAACANGRSQLGFLLSVRELSVRG